MAPPRPLEKEQSRNRENKDTKHHSEFKFRDKMLKCCCLMVQYTVYLDHNVKVQQKRSISCSNKLYEAILSKIFGTYCNQDYRIGCDLCTCVFGLVCVCGELGFIGYSRHSNCRSYSGLASVVMATPSHCVCNIYQLLVLSLADLLMIVN